jgi:hypothetical protein
MTTALWVARAIHYDLTLVNASAWHWWTALSREDYKDGLIYTDYQNPGDPETIIPSKLLWAFGNFSRFIRPGMVRVKLDGADDIDGLMGSAYADAKRKQIVVVFVNAGDAPVAVRLSFAGLPSGARVGPLTPHVTSDAAGDDLKESSAVSAGDTYVVPGRSVVTLTAAIS